MDASADRRADAEEASSKLGQPVKADVMRPLQAWDSGGKARAFFGMVEAMASATAAGLDADEVAKLFSLFGWSDNVNGGPLS